MNYKYKTLFDFKQDNRGEYYYLAKNNLLETFCKEVGWVNTLKRESKWNRETCLEKALLYTTKRDWKKHDQGSYEASRSSEWFDECVAHMIELVKPSGFWNKENCIKEASIWSTLKIWTKNSPTSVANARKNGWYDECVAHMEPIRKVSVPSIRQKSGHWTKENFLLECENYDTFYDLKLNNPSACECARGKGYLDEVVLSLGWDKRKPLGRKVNKWNKEKCLESALKYTTKVGWEKGDTNAYGASRRMGWYEECTAHMSNLIKTRGYWTKETCLEEALKYKTKIEWKTNHNSSYGSATKNKWINECTGHMIEGCKPRGYWTKERCIEEALKYNGRTFWRDNHQVTYNKAKLNNWIDECTIHMPQPKILTKKGYWTKERCLSEAKLHSRKLDWVRNSSGSVNSAKKNGWYDECVAHMK